MVVNKGVFSYMLRLPISYRRILATCSFLEPAPWHERCAMQSLRREMRSAPSETNDANCCPLHNLSQVTPLTRRQAQVPLGNVFVSY